MTIWQAIALSALVAASVSCKARAALEKPHPSRSASPLASAAPLPASSASACEPPAAPTASAAVEIAAAPPPRTATGDACRLVRGPIQLSLTGPATLWSGGAGEPEPHVLFNQDGVPQAVKLPATVKKSAAPAACATTKGADRPDRLALADPAERATVPGCARAGSALFCADKSGAIHRTTLAGGAGPVVAQARPGAPIAAAMIGASHVVYAFLADRKTSEGATTMAFAALDDAPPVQLSEDGAGATFVTLGARGGEVVAMYIDARRALTPVHARTITGADKLTLGPDAVVFVGDGTDGRTTGALAQGSLGGDFALLPIFKDTTTFGMAAIRVEERPRDDAAVSWSLYPAGIDRAPIAATQGTSPVRVLRVRPAAAAADAKRALELGELDAAGAFKELCTIGESATFTDLGMLVDGGGDLWLTYTDADGTWIERRGRGM